ncbi:MAG: SRPBCC family protein [Kofleriaceae bacterium]
MPAKPARRESNELSISRLYDAPVDLVWDAWTDPARVAMWWGPRGFTLTHHAKDLRPGGTWRYTMHGPDGVDYPNVTHYHVVEPRRRLVYDHGATDETPPLFRVNVTFTEVDGKTRMDMTMTFATPEVAEQTRRFIKQAGGEGTWDRLAEHLGDTPDAPRFVINRTFDAPIAQVFSMWTEPEHIARWLPPTGAEARFHRAEIAVGKTTFFSVTGPHGTLHATAEYLAIEPPRLVVYRQRFCDADERPQRPPMGPDFPLAFHTTVELTAEADDRTRVTVTWRPDGDVSAAGLASFVAARPGMAQGWTGSFDKLEALLEA